MSTEKSLTDFGSRIEQLIKALGFTQSSFAESLGVRQSHISGIKYGGKASETLVLLLCCKYAVNREWLETGSGEMFAHRSLLSVGDRISPTILLASEVKEKPEVAIQDYYAAPLVDGKIAAGEGLQIDEHDILSLVWIYAPEIRDRRNHNLFSVQISDKDGDSMMPTLFPGDIVLIDRNDPGADHSRFKSGAIYAIRDGEGGCAVKRIYKDRKLFVIGSDNREKEPRIVWTKDMQELIIGRVVWGWRNLLKA